MTITLHLILFANLTSKFYKAMIEVIEVSMQTKYCRVTVLECATWQVFVKNLDKATGEPELRDLFSKRSTQLDSLAPLSNGPIASSRNTHF